MTASAFADHARGVVARHGGQIIAEVPTVLRRVGLFVLVMTVSVPVFLVGLLIVLWRLGN
jgi:hypothetical protein